MHVYLIGYRGSGKTTVGRALAGRMGWTTVDCDDLIEQAAQCTIRDIFQREGESGFRDREESVIRQLAEQATKKPQVVSLGGGAILRESNRARICESGFRIWLTASAQTLVNRIRKDQSTAERRPALSAMNDYDEVVSVLEKRQPLYMSVAQKSVDTETLTVECICDEILAWLRTQPGMHQ